MACGNIDYPRTRREFLQAAGCGFGAVACGSREVQRSTEKAFMRLAQAGGGAYAQLLTQPGGEESTPEPPSEAIARHVLTLAFGARWQSQVEAFVGVYMTYHRNGFLR